MSQIHRGLYLTLAEFRAAEAVVSDNLASYSFGQLTAELSEFLGNFTTIDRY